MGELRLAFMFNDKNITPPTEWNWSPIVVGTNLAAKQNRSPMWRLEFRRRVVDRCLIDWFDYDNQRLLSITVPPHDALGETRRYTFAVVQQVAMRHRLGVGNELVATIVVNIES